MRAIPLTAMFLLACGSDDPAALPVDEGDVPAEDARDASMASDAAARPLDAGTVAPVRDAAEAGTRDAATRDAAPGDDSLPNIFPTTKEPHVTEAPFFNVTRPKDLTGRTWPVIAWANGGCVRSDFTWQPLFDSWAAGGYVVLSLSANGEGDPLGGLLAMLQQTSKVEHRALFDWVEKQNASGPYAGKLDLERLVLAGNSCGGVTALEAAAEEPRAAAVFVLSGSSAIGSVNTEVMGKISVPVGYVVGGEDDIAGTNAKADYPALKEGMPAMLVSRREGDHMTVSTDAKILPEVADIALAWMDLALYGRSYDELTASRVCDACTPGDWSLQSKHLETLRK
jgi:dienelactone hydrolase